jgi:hypothetical protein
VGEACTALEPGLIGAYTSAVAEGGSVWVAGYLEGNYNDPAFVYKYGDLVVGKWNDDASKVDWTIVDGVPSDPVDTTKFDINGFRGGQSLEGDDVGLWTSVALGPDGNPAVAYYDRTNKALKFAQLIGDTWSVTTVSAVTGADVGRYAKLLFVGGVPVIAYLAILPAEGPGPITSKVVVATSASPTPGDGDWTEEDVIVSDTTPCRVSFCPSTTVCIAATGLCTEVVEGCAKCAPSEGCVDDGGPKCEAKFDKNKLDSYPDAVGDYIALAPDTAGGFGIAYYDRTHGNLFVASKASGAWSSLLVDGQAGETDTGDMGIGASLSIDSAGDWHVAYVDGYAEAVRYAKIAQGTTLGATELVDDGLSVGGLPFDDGQHLVGDDSSIFVTSSGEVHITYQDATGGTLHYAVGVPSGAGHTWTVTVVEQPDTFAGAFSKVLGEGGVLRIVNWWRKGGERVVGDVAIVTP